MVYKKKFYKKKSGTKLYKKKTYKKRKFGNRCNIMRVKPEVKQTYAVSTDNSTFVTEAETQLGTTSSIYQVTHLLNGVASSATMSSGTSAGGRIGASIHGVRIKCNLSICSKNSTSTDLNSRAFYRVIMFIDKDYDIDKWTAGTVPVASDLLNEPTSSSTNDEAILSPYNYALKRQFGILHDKVYQARSYNGAWIRKQFSIPLNNPHRFGGSAITDGNRGRIWLLVIMGADQGNGSLTTNDTIVKVQSRYFYVDK